MTVAQSGARAGNMMLAAIRTNRKMWIAAGTLTLALLILPAMLKLDGKAHAD